MTTLRLILGEIMSLFIDDGSLALAILAVVGAAGLLAFGFHAAPLIVGAVIFLGCLAALIENALRAGRRR